MVLLDAAARVLGVRAGGCLAAVHVNHGLHPDAGAWEDHCREAAARYAIAIEVRRVEVGAAAGGGGIEAAARAARLDAFADAVPSGDSLLLAHHRDDQAETALLRILRGAGPAGMAAMRPEVTVGAFAWSGPSSRCRGRRSSPTPASGASTGSRIRPTSTPRTTGTTCGTGCCRPSRSAGRTPARPSRGSRRGPVRPRRCSTHSRRRTARRRAGGPPAPSARPRSRPCRRTAPRTRSERGSSPAIGSRRPPANGSGSSSTRWRGPVRTGGRRRRGAASGCAVTGETSTPGGSARRRGSPRAPPGASTPGRSTFPTGVSPRCGSRGRGSPPRGSRPSSRCASGAAASAAGRTRRGVTKPLKDLFQELGIPPWERGERPLVYAGDRLAAAPGLFLCDPFAAGAGEPAWRLEWTPRETR